MRTISYATEVNVREYLLALEHGQSVVAWNHELSTLISRLDRFEEYILTPVGEKTTMIGKVK